MTYLVTIKKTGKRTVYEPDNFRHEPRTVEVDDNQFVKVFSQKFEKLDVPKLIITLNGGDEESADV